MDFAHIECPRGGPSDYAMTIDTEVSGLFGPARRELSYVSKATAQYLASPAASPASASPMYSSLGPDSCKRRKIMAERAGCLSVNVGQSEMPERPPSRTAACSVPALRYRPRGACASPVAASPTGMLWSPASVRRSPSITCLASYDRLPRSSPVPVLLPAEEPQARNSAAPSPVSQSFASDARPPSRSLLRHEMMEVALTPLPRVMTPVDRPPSRPLSRARSCQTPAAGELQQRGFTAPSLVPRCRSPRAEERGVREVPSAAARKATGGFSAGFQRAGRGEDADPRSPPMRSTAEASVSSPASTASSVPSLAATSSSAGAAVVPSTAACSPLRAALDALEPLELPASDPDLAGAIGAAPLGGGCGALPPQASPSSVLGFGADSGLGAGDALWEGPLELELQALDSIWGAPVTF